MVLSLLQELNDLGAGFGVPGAHDVHLRAPSEGLSKRAGKREAFNDFPIGQVEHENPARVIGGYIFWVCSNASYN